MLGDVKSTLQLLHNLREDECWISPQVHRSVLSMLSQLCFNSVKLKEKIDHTSVESAVDKA